MRQFKMIANRQVNGCYLISIVIKKMQIKIRFIFLPVSKIEKQLIIFSIAEHMQKQVLWCHYILVQLFGRAVWQFLSEFKMFKSFYLAVLSLSTLIKCFNMCTKMYVQGYLLQNFYVIVENQRQPECQSKREQVHKLWNNHNVDAMEQF